MWQKTHSILAENVSKAQLWQLFENVNQWHTWDEGIEYARLEGAFAKGNTIVLRPKGGPEVKVRLLEVNKPGNFLDVTAFPLAKMYDQHIFEDTPGGLRITNTITVKGLLSFLWVKLVARNLVSNLPADMQRQAEAARKLPVTK